MINNGLRKEKKSLIFVRKFTIVGKNKIRAIFFAIVDTKVCL